MSDDAKTLLHYADNYRFCDPHDSDKDFCRSAAAAWAAYIIAKATQ